jgi:hypothetical protein
MKHSCMNDICKILSLAEKMHMNWWRSDLREAISDLTNWRNVICEHVFEVNFPIKNDW